MSQVVTLDRKPARGRPITSGIFSKALILNGEKRADFNQLLSDTYDYFDPAPGIEEALVNEIVRLTWRLYRLDRIEAELAREAMSNVEREPPPQVASAMCRVREAEEWLARLQHAKDAIDRPTDMRGFDSAIDHLASLWYGFAELKDHIPPVGGIPQFHVPPTPVPERLREAARQLIPTAQKEVAAQVKEAKKELAETKRKVAPTVRARMLEASLLPEEKATRLARERSGVERRRERLLKQLAMARALKGRQST